MGLLNLTPEQYQGIASMGSAIANSAWKGRPWDINSGVDAYRNTYNQAIEKKRLIEEKRKQMEIEKAKNELEAWYKGLQGQNIQEQIFERKLKNKNLPTELQLGNEKTNQEVNLLIGKNNTFMDKHNSEMNNKLLTPDGKINTPYLEAKKEIGFTSNPNYAPNKADAGKAAMLDTAYNSVSRIKNMLLTPDGKLNPDANSLIRGAQAIGVTDIVSPFFDPKAGKLANDIEVAIQSVTRIETGAAMQKNEINNTRQRFQPKWQDSPETKVQKILALELFVKNAGKYIKGKPGSITVDFDAVMNDAKSVISTGQITQQDIEAEMKKRGLQ